jgi:GT2 family glycosyltransferase
MKLSIIIISYNAKDLLNQCLISVQNSVKDIENEIIVVDNNSAENIRGLLTNSFSLVKSVYLEENRGFANACNLGYKLSTGEYVLFLNPDTIISTDSLNECISFFESTADAGALGVRMINEKRKFLKESKRALPSVTGSFFKLFGLATLFPRSKIFAKYYSDQLPEKETNAVDVLSGAFMMVRKKVLEEIGGFDEDFFMYGEDIDLSYRITKTGYKNYYLGGVTITHLKGGSTTYDKKQAAHFYKSMKIFVDKHYKGKKSLLVIWLLYAGIWFRKMITITRLLFR